MPIIEQKCSVHIDSEQNVPYNKNIRGGYSCNAIAFFDEFAKFAYHCVKSKTKENYYGTL